METKKKLFTSSWGRLDNFTSVFDGAAYFQNFRGEACILTDNREINPAMTDETFVAVITAADWVTFPTNEFNAGMKRVVTNTCDGGYGAPPFTDEEVAAARAVVEEYWRAKTAYDREAILKTVTEPNRADNMVYFSEGEKITLNDIRYDPFDSTRAEYIKTGRGSVNGTRYEDVIVFRVDYTVEDKGYSAYSEGPYTDWGMILIRSGKGGDWLIDDQGY